MNLPLAEPGRRSDRWRIALIPILAGILFWNLTGSGKSARDESSLVSPVANEQTLSAAEQLVRQLQRNRERAKQKNWPGYGLGDLLDYDPFSLTGTLAERSGLLEVVPELTATPETERSATDSDDADSATTNVRNPVLAVTIGPNGAAALTDSGIVRVGDVLEDGVRVVAIERGAVIVEMTN